MAMKIIGTFSLAVAASFTLMQSAEARGGAHFSGGAHFAGSAHYSGGPHYSASARGYSGPRSYGGPSRNFSSASGRYYSPRISSIPSNRSWSAAGPRFSPTSTALRNPTFTANARRFSGDRTAAFNSRTTSRSTAHFSAANRALASSHGFDRGRVIAQHSASTWHRNWDRGHDHSWHGHRCHFQNGFWFIYDPFLWYPYGYGYGYGYGYDYPYETYYDSSYDNGSRPVEEYSQAPEAKDSEYAGDARVSDVQSALAREGYYDGAIDGKLGPSTRNALRRYQRDHGLDATGGITSGVIQALRLR